MVAVASAPMPTGRVRKMKVLQWLPYGTSLSNDSSNKAMPFEMDCWLSQLQTDVVVSQFTLMEYWLFQEANIPR